MFSKGVFYWIGNQKGQALLIIVLVMVVALTVGLSVASRTITNLRNTRDQANSQKALSAAEAGVEQAIKNNAGVAGSFTGKSGSTTYSTTVNAVNGTVPFLLNGKNVVPKNDAIYVWVTPYSANPANLWQNPWSGNLTIYWGNSSGDCNNAAVEISVISGSQAAPVLTRYTADPCLARRGSNNFSTAAISNTTISGTRLYYSRAITITNGLLVRVNPIYSNAVIGVSGNIALPLQGNIITSIGTSDNTTQRKVTVYQGYPEIPAEFFPYILFSP